MKKNEQTGAQAPVLSNIEIQKDLVFKALGMPEDRTVPEEAEAAYEQLLPVLYDLVKPLAKFKYGIIDGDSACEELPCGTPVLYVLIGLGGKICEKIEGYFRRDGYLEGTLLDAMADVYLFQLDEAVTESIRGLCDSLGIGVSRRLEAPGQLPMQAQKVILENILEEEAVDVRLTSGYMYDPIKTMGYILVMSTRKGEFHALHDCNNCKAVNCAMRKKCMMNCAVCTRTDCKMRGQWDKEENFAVLDKYEGERTRQADDRDDEYVIAVDIGTTTIVLQLAGRESGAIFGSHSGINHQRRYGADVISRIQSSVTGNGGRLKESIQQDLAAGIHSLLKQTGTDPEMVQEIAISGNTTMLHLLMGYPCDKLGVAPFTPYRNERRTLPCQEVIPDSPISCPVTLLPGISAFVGADIVAGLLYVGILQQDTPILFLDLGTNGEMAIGNKERLMVTSTAAGPVFEGGNIAYGTGSVPGAICHITMESPSDIRLETIDDKPPVGLCGTGILEGIAELLRLELIDENGLLDEEYFEEGFPLCRTEQGETILITQKDIREIQLAKSAIRAGLETLLLEYGITASDVDALYVAGGFGYRLDIQKAASIGLLPELLLPKTIAIGNSSLGGAMSYLLEENTAEETDQISHYAQEISLANNKAFQELYMKHMFFDEEE